MENFLEQFGVINLVALVWLAFLFAIWRAVRLESRDRCTWYALNHDERIREREHRVLTWRMDHTPQYRPAYPVHFAADVERYIQPISRAIERGDAGTAGHFAKLSAHSALSVIGREY